MLVTASPENTRAEPAAAMALGTPYGTLPPASPMGTRRPISLPRLLEMHTRGEKITMLTAYDATFAAVADAAGVECILVGDSLGMVCQGLHSTVGVSLEDMRYHTESVAHGIRRSQGTAWVIADLPFGTYQESKEQAFRSAAVLMQAGAHMIKLEGGGWTTEVVHFLVQRGIPVCAHLGLTPQTVHALGGYRVQGREPEAAAARWGERGRGAAGGGVKTESSGMASPTRSPSDHSRDGWPLASAGGPGATLLRAVRRTARAGATGGGGRRRGSKCNIYFRKTSRCCSSPQATDARALLIEAPFWTKLMRC